MFFSLQILSIEYSVFFVGFNFSIADVVLSSTLDRAKYPQILSANVKKKAVFFLL